MARFRRAWGEAEERDQRRTVLSIEQERNLSAEGSRARDVTGWVWPRK